MHKKDPNRLVVLVRHGKSTFNIDGRIQGHSFKSRLTSKGKEQSLLLAYALREKYSDFEFLYSSDLPRAEETTKIIAPHVGINEENIIYDANLRELYRGKWEDTQPYESEKWQKFQRKLDIGIDNIPDGLSLETYENASQRMCGFFEKLLKENDASKILIVSHGEINKVALSFLMGNTLDRLLTSDRHTLNQPNCCINEITYSDGHLYVLKTGDISYFLSNNK